LLDFEITSSKTGNHVTETNDATNHGRLRPFGACAERQINHTLSDNQIYAMQRRRSRRVNQILCGGGVVLRVPVRETKIQKFSETWLQGSGRLLVSRVRLQSHAQRDIHSIPSVHLHVPLVKLR